MKTLHKLASLQSQISTLGLNGWWKMYEHTFFDYSLNGNDGTAANTAVADRGILFNGADSVVTVSADATIALNAGDWTYSQWANITSDGEGDSGYILSKDEFLLWTLTDDGTVVDISSKVDFGVGTDAIVSLTNKITLAVWHHIVLVFNATTKVLTLYIDGVAPAQAQQTGIGTVTDDSAVDLEIGNNAAGNTTFDGILSDVQFYSVVKSASEILSIYSQTRQRYGV